ncbi:Thermostable hemolysin [Mariprofundus ferrinatatus]|uniref:Thermostable hemolysin n=1 Tax=Mariprofundus ferrinatatus TaxID=1921087 RepID=A0A2K8L4P5_9PROT|nr:thermostable hemolysin [Mariprofundus ferrinatatus]ATX82257.1 Thermostable hemolysin [Mariprofundus ferrinatatus]
MFEVLHKGQAGYDSATAFVHKVFARVYGADIQRFMPNFIRIHDSKNRTVAAMGFRDAATGPLYLENYLDEPIEVAISRYMGVAIDRSEIVEVGNLAEAKPGDARMAIIGATSYLYTAGYRWVVFTGVTRLRNAFVRLGLSPKQLLEVDERRLPEDEVKQWGSYYDGDPVVCFGSIQGGHDNLQELWAALRDTWAAAEIEGEKAARIKKQT